MAAVDVLIDNYRQTRAVDSRLPTSQLVRQERQERQARHVAEGGPDWPGVAHLAALRDELEARGDPPPPVLRSVR